MAKFEPIGIIFFRFLMQINGTLLNLQQALIPMLSFMNVISLNRHVYVFWKIDVAEKICHS